MYTKTFATGLIAAYATAIQVAEKTEGYQPLHAPRIKLTGPYYRTRPYYKEPANDYPEIDDGHVSTDDDRYSSSSSDSVSSSDVNEASEKESTCERDGDIYACLRVQTQKDCNALQNLNPLTCLCEEKYTCPQLADSYGKSTCPNQNYGLTPFTSPLDNCACQSQPERDAMFDYAYAGKCDHGPKFEKALPPIQKLRICDSQTDSDSDCVKIGGRRNVKGSRNLKQRDDQGHVDSSIYVDSDCNPLFSSCDTNSNEEFSNTDSDTMSSVSSHSKRTPPKLHGRLHDRYAKKYGVRLPEKKEKKKHHGYGYGHDKEIDTRSFGTDSLRTSYDSSIHGIKESYIPSVLSVGDTDYVAHVSEVRYDEGYTQDENRSNVDDCDSDDIAAACIKPEQPESVDYVEESESTATYYPSKGTSNSSNSTNDPFSDSESDLNSSSQKSVHEVAEEHCANVWFDAHNGSDLWGWANLYQPAEGTYAGYTKITADFQRLAGQGEYKFTINEYADQDFDCSEVGLTYNPTEEMMEEDALGYLSGHDTLFASWRGRANYYDWNPNISLYGPQSVAGRSMVVTDANDNRIGCGIINYGCSPCAAGNCSPPKEHVKKDKKKRHYPY